MKKNSFWLYLEPYIHLSISKDKALIYNSLNQRCLEYNNNAPEVLTILKKLGNKRNTYCIEFCYSLIKNKKEVDKFIINLKRYFFGDIVLYKDTKPIFTVPEISIKNSLKSLSRDDVLSIGYEAKLYLREITIYTGSIFSNSDFMMAVNPNTIQINESQASTPNIYNLFNKLITEISEYPFLDLINIICDINFNNNTTQSFLNTLKENNKRIVIHLNIDEFIRNYNKFQNNLEYLIYIQHDYTDLNRIFSIHSEHKNCQFIYLVKSEEDFVHFKILNEKLANFVTIKPLYDNNYNFFREYVYVGKKDLLNQRLSISEILTNKILNKYFFGKLLIYDNGEMRSNLFSEIGLNLSNATLTDQILFELKNNISWMKVRKNVKPCSNCIYNSLCPPISNYEIQLNKFNLCTIY